MKFESLDRSIWISNKRVLTFLFFIETNLKVHHHQDHKDRIFNAYDMQSQVSDASTNVTSQKNSKASSASATVTNMDDDPSDVMSNPSFST